MNMDKIDWAARRRQLEQWQAPTPDLWLWLKDINLAWGGGPQVLQGIDRLSQGAVAVITGQQAGLLTGPLYTIYKAASTIILARQLEERFQIPVVPVFWLASEDHDFVEVRSAYFPVGRGEEMLFPGDFSLTPAAEIPLPQSAVEEVIHQLKSILPQSEYSPEVFSLLREAASGSFSDWCGGLLCRLFGQHGLVLLDSCGLPVRSSARPVYRWAIDEGPEIHRLLAAAGAGMAAQGRKPGLDVPRDHSHIFLLHQGQRLGLLRRGNTFVDGKNTISLSRQELLDIAQEEPWRLSPNVVLRPLVQELVLPVLAMVGGPGELAYLEQLVPVFARLGLSQPPVLPRMGGVLVEPPIARLLDKYKLTPTQDIDAWLEDTLKQADSLDISEVFADFRQKFQGEYAQLIHGLADIDPQLTQLGEKNLDKIMEQVKWLEGRAHAAFRQKHGDVIRHGQRLKMALAPRGQEQQRLHNVFWYINKYGPDLLATILEQPLVQDLTIYL